MAASPFQIESACAPFLFDQSLRKLHHCYARLRAAEAAYNIATAVLDGREEPPLIRVPSGTIDADGNLIILELSYHRLAPVSEAERAAAVRRSLEPWSQWLQQEYHRWAMQLAQAAANAAGAVESSTAANNVSGVM